MTAGRRILLFLLPCVLLAGCRRNDMVESELRQKEAAYRDAVTELKRLEAQNDALFREVGALRQSYAPGTQNPPPEAATAFGLKRITLGRGTGGYDNDNLPGDEALQVVVEPRDADDHVVKVPGSLHVTAVEINSQGLKHPLCWWSMTAEQLRPTWKQGLLSTGYAVVMPWTVFPQHELVRVVVQFKLADGRCFEADKDVKVRLLPITPHFNDPAPLPGPTPLIAPAGAIRQAQELRWSPASPSEGIILSRPQPLDSLPVATDPLPIRE